MTESPGIKPSRVPMTPMRRILRTIEFNMRPMLAHGKRHRGGSYAPSTEGLDLLATAAEATLLKKPEYVSSDWILEPVGPAMTGGYEAPTQAQSSQNAPLAIQQQDHPLDAIVITTLPRYPFCCHEELLTMSRKQLIDVATLFNCQLSCTTQIDLSEMVTDAHIRHSIEVLVGIVPDTPAAPKAIKSRTLGVKSLKPDPLDDACLDILPSSPISPLAMRLTRRRGLSHVQSSSCLLERLDEEEEYDFLAHRRSVKRRKVSESIVSPTRILYEDDVENDITPPRFLTFSACIDSLSPSDISSSDVDMSVFSPLQNSGRAFATGSGSSFLNQGGGFLNSRPHYVSNPNRRSSTKSKRAQQICHPMGKLHMNSVSLASPEVAPMDML